MGMFREIFPLESPSPRGGFIAEGRGWPKAG